MASGVRSRFQKQIQVRQMQYSAQFQTLAEIAIGLAGFTGIIIAVRPPSEGLDAAVERARLRELLLASLGVVFFSFAPSLLEGALSREGLGWRVSQLALAAYHVVLIVLFFRDTTVFSSRIRIDWLVVAPFGVITLVGQVLTGLGFLSEQLQLTYYFALLFFLFVGAFHFALLLLPRKARQ